MYNRYKQETQDLNRNAIRGSRDIEYIEKMQPIVL